MIFLVKIKYYVKVTLLFENVSVLDDARLPTAGVKPASCGCDHYSAVEQFELNCIKLTRNGMKVSVQWYKCGCKDDASECVSMRMKM